jgi:hypothetical protein
MLQVPTTADMALFKGKDVNFYSIFAEQALLQAAFLLSIRTGLSETPDSEPGASLAKFAIMDLAHQMYLEAPYDEILAKPFSSESIGSYSYSKSAQAARKGETTGSMWFDLAVEQLSDLNGSYDVNSGSISVFERSDYYQTAEGDRYVLGPADYNHWDQDYYYINSDRRA